MQKLNENNYAQFGEKLRMQEFYVPEWLKPSALSSFIRFNYTGVVKLEEKNRERADEALHLYRCACYFYDSQLQEAVVAEEIIPNMNTYSAIMFINEVQTTDSEQKSRR